MRAEGTGADGAAEGVATDGARAGADAAGLLARYRPLPGVPDELKDAQGRMRPVWAGLLAHMDARPPGALEADFARGRQHLADAGVFFRGYGERSALARDWPFSPVPVLLPEEEFARIARGLIQRADLLEAVAADLYGANRLVAEGRLPAPLIARNPEWLRPMVGVVPRGGHFLHFVAFEIGRGPDGRWWVLDDRTDAPSGAGFALENRVAATRAFPDVFRRTDIARLDGFFGAFRDALGDLSGEPAARIGILTPGPLTDTYYEQAYIARHLGLTLLEGGDLAASARGIAMRTVGGAEPVRVLWRRMDGIWADPLELREDSRIGTPGLMAAVREGQVTLVNALGVGILETQALMAFLPAIHEARAGAPLALPNVATWWCGGARQRDHVRAHAGRMMIGPAMATRMPYETAAPHAVGGVLRGQPGTAFEDWLESGARDLMAKEMVSLSTTPVWKDGALVPRPMTIRLFLARTPAGWAVMPGGFARIGAGANASAIAMRAGGSVADVWVVGSGRGQGRGPAAVAAPAPGPDLRAGPAPLPSRAADNLFWLGRYVERTEALLRLSRAWHARQAEAAPAPLLALIAASLTANGVEAEAPLPAGVIRTLGHAANAAGRIRDRFSVDAFAALTDLEKSMARVARTARPGADAALAASVMLRKIAGFSGLVHDNMVRGAGWQFLTLGRAVERSAAMAALLAAATARSAPPGSLDLAIEIGDSVIVHRQRHGTATSRATVLGLLALDADNPRAIRFQLDVACARTGDLARGRSDGAVAALADRAAQMRARVADAEAETLDPGALSGLRAAVFAFSDALGRAVLA